MENLHITLLFATCMLLTSQCNSPKQEPTATLTQEAFGTLADGRQVNQFTLTNSQGLEMKVINLGGIITSLSTPDREGNMEDIVLGFDHLEGYLQDHPYFGAIIGRYGNRIAKGKFEIDGEEYSLAVNNFGNHLHGGLKGFDKAFWEIAPFENTTGVGLVLTYISPDMEEGYPGTLRTKVTYFLGNDNTLKVDYEAITDRTTVLNLTQHTYFNLTGGAEDVLNHQVYLNADHYLPVDTTLIPTGELAQVANTPFDFLTSKVIGKDINATDEQLEIAGGFDHCWVINETSDTLGLAAVATEPKSGRKLEVYTNEPGVQLYTGNFLDGSITGKKGKKYAYRSGFCFETQHFPDSPNQPKFPSVLLAPGETFTSTTIFKFSIE